MKCPERRSEKVSRYCETAAAAAEQSADQQRSSGITADIDLHIIQRSFESKEEEEEENNNNNNNNNN